MQGRTYLCLSFPICEMEVIIIVPHSFGGRFSEVIHVKSSEPYLAHAKWSRNTSCYIIKYVLLLSLFDRWGPEKRSNLSKGIGLGSAEAQDLNPGLLTPERRSQHQAGRQVLSVSPGEPLGTASDSRRQFPQPCVDCSRFKAAALVS